MLYCVVAVVPAVVLDNTQLETEVVFAGTVSVGNDLADYAGSVVVPAVPFECSQLETEAVVADTLAVREYSSLVASEGLRAVECHSTCLEAAAAL